MEMAQRSFLDRSPSAMEMHLSELQASFLLHGHLRAFSAHQGVTMLDWARFRELAVRQ
jgi:hypothetical protein